MIIAFFEIVQIVLVDSIKDRPTAAPRECWKSGKVSLTLNKILKTKWAG